MLKKCNRCLLSSPIVSENGIESKCVLSQREGFHCRTGNVSKFIPKSKEKFKIFISVGMNGREPMAVIEDLRRATENIYAECKKHCNYNPEDIEIFHNYNCEGPSNASRLWYLGEAIKKLGECDMCYFVDGWEDHKGCMIELEICKAYNIDISIEPKRKKGN